MMTEFQGFPKIKRYSREVIVTEKIDGTNAQIFIGEDGEFLTASRKRWITPENDNFGFSKWAHENQEELMELGPGRHFGEWWGQGIQRKYGLKEKRFSLFNTVRWSLLERPTCVDTVPVLWEGSMDNLNPHALLLHLERQGSYAEPGFMNPEGIVIYHTAANICFKKTFDDRPKDNHGA